MKLIATLTLGMLLAASVPSHALEHSDCTASSERGRCKTIPAPPAPPAPPALPIPAPPAPPLPPAPPQVPDSAHAACQDKTVGTTITLTPRASVTMTGTCQKDSRGMYFDVQSIRDRS